MPPTMLSVRRHVALAAGRSFALAAVALTGLFSLLEFVEQLASVGQGRYRVIDAFLYVLLTAPSRLLQVAPVALLVGCLLSLGAMARNAELTAMQAIGLSERRIVGAVLWLVPPLALALFLLMQLVIPPAQQLAGEWRAAALSASSTSRGDSGFWAQHDRQYLNVQRFERANVPVGIDIYGFRPDGSLASVLEADRADIRADGTWLLTHVTRRRVQDWRIQIDHLPALTWRSFISPRQIRFLIVPLDSVAPTALFRHIRELQPDQQAPRETQVLWFKASLPLVLAAMIVASAPFVFGPPRAQGGGHYLTRGLAVGIVFSLGQQILGRLGLLLALNPALTALTPPLLLIGFSAWALRRRRQPHPAP